MSGDKSDVNARSHEMASVFQKTILDMIEKTSVDWLSSSTRAVLDKLLIFALTGIALCALDNPVTAIFGGIAQGKLLSAWMMPIAVAAIVAFYVTSLNILARADYKRWDAQFAIHLAKVVEIFDTAMKSVGYFERVLNEHNESVRLKSKNTDSNSVAEDVTITAIVIDLMDMLDRHLKFAQKTLEPGNDLHKQAKRLMWFYIVLPTGFSIASIVALLYLTWSLVHNPP